MRCLAATGGIMWYLQFFFYAWGAANIPQQLSYVNWMLHMSSYVLCGGLVGLALGEWAGVGSRPVRMLWAGMLVIIAAANLVWIGMAIIGIFTRGSGQARSPRPRRASSNSPGACDRWWRIRWLSCRASRQLRR